MGNLIQFYGLYWSREYVDWQQEKLWGTPRGWIGRGKLRKDERPGLRMNFWRQKGVYVLYNLDLHPVYAGQAGLGKKGKRGSGSLGTRLYGHRAGKYRNGWTHFSWFGFLNPKHETELKSLRTASEEMKSTPGWEFRGKIQPQDADSEEVDRGLTELLDSFEAILIEAFAPRFNARGGNLKDATWVDQFEHLGSLAGDPTRDDVDVDD